MIKRTATLCMNRAFVRYMSTQKHPWIKSGLPLSDEETILTFLSGNAAAGNLSNLTVDWKYLPESYHPIGILIPNLLKY